MFQKDDLVVYGNMGVCKVVDVGVPNFCKVQERKLYYTLAPQDQTGVIFAPTDTSVFMRPVLTRKEAEALIGMIPEMQAEAYHASALQELTAHYTEALHSHDCADLVTLLMSIYAKKQDRLSRNQKVGTVDEAFMRRAETLLYGELSAALGIPAHDVPAYIASRLKPAKKAAQK